MKYRIYDYYGNLVEHRADKETAISEARQYGFTACDERGNIIYDSAMAHGLSLPY